ncbi:efflux RND transporter periplasmic adaptor subunit [Microbulbifer yueqingensis]|uniref:RND family efflux transporter, MFP subunit n=1 Tax=Microbulbifer yueqingensis TaxID=658219 RepID=A0A1G8UCL6_9GAMM|nr:efflux RND transporter periplasmic adaptor subunit [Microbulbifer yueqingensis]SDJ51334.1 RND family efflux transporter, MFP subunit [Microbulbifer yueqingensis]
MDFLSNSRRVLFAVLLATAGLVACSDPESAQQQDERVWPVKVAPVSSSGEVAARQFAGRVKAVQTVDLSFQVGGKLQGVKFKEGEVIPRGQLIATLDDRDFRRRVKQARVNLELLEKTLERQRALKARNMISAQQLDETESNYDLAQVALENAEQELAYTRLRVPFDALVTRQLVENFTNVQPGQGIVRLQDVSEVRVQVSVPEKLLATIDANRVDSITASFEFLPGQEFPLEYREHQAEADSVTQTYVVELGMPRPDNVQILPGMTARVRLRLARADGELRVPLSAVQTNADGTPYVWQIGDDRRVSRVEVALGRTDGELVRVTEGLQPGVQLVAAGGQHLYEGAVVRDYTAAGAPAPAAAPGTPAAAGTEQ